jgi:hypothetical protein
MMSGMGSTFAKSMASGAAFGVAYHAVGVIEGGPEENRRQKEENRKALQRRQKEEDCEKTKAYHVNV